MAGTLNCSVGIYTNYHIPTYALDAQFMFEYGFKVGMGGSEGAFQQRGRHECQSGTMTPCVLGVIAKWIAIALCRKGKKNPTELSPFIFRKNEEFECIHPHKCNVFVNLNTLHTKCVFCSE